MSNSMYKDSNSVATILAIRNQMAASLGIGFESDRTTTINTKRQVLASKDPTTFPKIRYFGIGIKGYANLTTENNIAQPYMPSAEDCDLYEPIPFRCVTTPLTGEEAADYRIRTMTTIGGVTYYQYWLKLIKFENPVVKTTKVVDGVEAEYTISSANLNPVPSDLYATDLSDSGKRIVASVTGTCRVTGAEVTEVINAMYGGDMRRARISEFGMYSGCEFPVADHEIGDFPAGTEAIYTQLCSHKCTLGQTLSDPASYILNRTVFENGSCFIV